MVAGGIFAVVYFADPTQQSPSNSGSATLSVPLTQEDHYKWDVDSPVVFVEYGDFQCPACKAHIPLIVALEEEFGDRVAMVWRHLPLPIHGNAEEAARASEAAAMQGKFWEMHDMLFVQQDNWAKEGNAEDVFAEYAVSLELNEEQFRQDYNSDEVKNKVQDDYDAAIRDGLQSTPSFFVDGKFVALGAGADRYQILRNLIIQALEQHGIQQTEQEPESGNATGGQQSTEATSSEVVD